MTAFSIGDAEGLGCVVVRTEEPALIEYRKGGAAEPEPPTPPTSGGSDQDGHPVASASPSSAEAREALPGESPGIDEPPRSDTDQEMLAWPLGLRLALVNAAQRWPEDLVQKVGEIGYGFGHYLDHDGGTEAVVERLRKGRVR